MKEKFVGLGLLSFGMLLFLGYTGAVLAFSLFISKPLVRRLIGETIYSDEIFNGVAFIIIALILVPLGNIMLYQQLKKKNHEEISKGMALGFLFSVVGLMIYYALNN